MNPFAIFLGLVAVILLGLSVNMGVAADRLRGTRSHRLVAIGTSIFCGVGALYCAYLIGTIAQPR